MAERQKCLDILGLTNGASEEDIKKAYKKLALQVHPDKNTSENANEKFQELSYAYKYLTEGPSSVKDENLDMRAEFFRRMFAEMFMPPEFFFGPQRGFPFFFSGPFEDDYDDYYYSSESSDDWVPNFSAYDRREGEKYKFSHTNPQPGPEMSSKQIKKKEKRRRQRARQKERKENKPNQRNANKQNSLYSDDINDSRGRHSESNKENKDRNQTNQPYSGIDGHKGPTDQSKPAKTAATPTATYTAGSTVKTERPSTPVRNEQQKMTKNMKKKIEKSEQRKREKEMEEIAAELLQQQEERAEKQKRKEEQERLQKEKKSSTNFEPFHEFHVPESKSRKQKKRERRKEEEDSKTTEDHCPLPAENKIPHEDRGIGQAKVSPFGPIGSKIPQTGKGSTNRNQDQAKMGSGTNAQEIGGEGHPRNWYNPYQDSNTGHSQQPGHAYYGPSQSQHRPPSQSQHRPPIQTKQQQRPVGKHIEPGTKPSGVDRTGSAFCQRNQFDVLAFSDEDGDNSSAENVNSRSFDDQPRGYMDLPKTFCSPTYHGQPPQHRPQSKPAENWAGGIYRDKSTDQLPKQPRDFQNQTHKSTHASFNLDRSARNRNQNGNDTLDDIDDSSSGVFSKGAPVGVDLGTSNKQQSIPGSNYCKAEKPSAENAYQYRQFRSSPSFGGVQDKGFHKPSPRDIPVFGGRATPPMNGYGPRHPPGNFGYPPAHGVHGRSQNQGHYNTYNRLPGFATPAQTPRPKAFSEGGYHNIGINSSGNYGNQFDQNSSGNHGNQFDQDTYAYRGNQKFGKGPSKNSNKGNPNDGIHMNGIKEGYKREGTPIDSNNVFGVGSLPSWQPFSNKATPSVKEPVIKSCRNSSGSLDSLDDFPVHSERSRDETLVNDGVFDLSNIEARFEGVLGQEELNVPGAMFTDSIKNYYK